MPEGEDNGKWSMMKYLLKFCWQWARLKLNKVRENIKVTGSNKYNVKGIIGVGKESLSDKTTGKFRNLSIP